VINARVGGVKPRIYYVNCEGKIKSREIVRRGSRTARAVDGIRPQMELRGGPG